MAAEAGIRDDERVKTVRGHDVFYLQDADGGIVEAPVTSSNFPMACFMTEKTYICIKSGQVEDKL